MVGSAGSASELSPSRLGGTSQLAASSRVRSASETQYPPESEQDAASVAFDVEALSGEEVSAAASCYMVDASVGKDGDALTEVRDLGSSAVKFASTSSGVAVSQICTCTCTPASGAATSRAASVVLSASASDDDLGEVGEEPLCAYTSSEVAAVSSRANEEQTDGIMDTATEASLAASIVARTIDASASASAMDRSVMQSASALAIDLSTAASSTFASTACAPSACTLPTLGRTVLLPSSFSEPAATVPSAAFASSLLEAFSDESTVQMVSYIDVDVGHSMELAVAAVSALGDLADRTLGAPLAGAAVATPSGVVVVAAAAPLPDSEPPSPAGSALASDLEEILEEAASDGSVMGRNPSEVDLFMTPSARAEKAMALEAAARVDRQTQEQQALVSAQAQVLVHKQVESEAMVAEREPVDEVGTGAEEEKDVAAVAAEEEAEALLGARNVEQEIEADLRAVADVARRLAAETAEEVVEDEASRLIAEEEALAEAVLTVQSTEQGQAIVVVQRQRKEDEAHIEKFALLPPYAAAAAIDNNAEAAVATAEALLPQSFEGPTADSDRRNAHQAALVMQTEQVTSHLLEEMLMQAADAIHGRQRDSRRAAPSGSSKMVSPNTAAVASFTVGSSNISRFEQRLATIQQAHSGVACVDQLTDLILREAVEELAAELQVRTPSQKLFVRSSPRCVPAILTSITTNSLGRTVRRSLTVGHHLPQRHRRSRWLHWLNRPEPRLR